MPSLTPFNRWRNWGPNMLNKVLSGIKSTGLPRWHSGKESACQGRRRKTHGFNPWVRKIPWRRKWQPTPVLLLEKFNGRRNLADYSPWGAESQSRLSMHTWLNIKYFLDCLSLNRFHITSCPLLSRLFLKVTLLLIWDWALKPILDSYNENPK